MIDRFTAESETRRVCQKLVSEERKADFEKAINTAISRGKLCTYEIGSLEDHEYIYLTGLGYTVDWHINAQRVSWGR